VSDAPGLTGVSVLVVGTHDPDYPRNRQVHRLLRAAGAQVRTRHVPLWGRTRFDALGDGVLGVLRLAARLVGAEVRVAWALVTAPRPDVVVVLFPGQADAVVVGALARLRRVPVVLDWFVSFADTMVTDRQLVAPRSPLARLLAAVDSLAARLATLVVADTPEGARFVAETTGVDPAKVVTLPIRPDPAVFRPAPAESTPVPGRVLFYGTFIPLHGIDTIVAAAAHPACAGLEVRVLGDGQERARIEAVARSTGAPVTFCAPVDEADLPAEIAAAEICLGIFGTTAKAGRVVPNKVLECLAVGRPVVTADTPAIAGLGDAVAVVPAGDPSALATALASLHADATRRGELVDRGLDLLSGPYDEGVLAASLAASLSAVVSLPSSLPSSSPPPPSLRSRLRALARRRRGQVEA